MATVIVDPMWSAAEAAALLLPASEREAVLGDLMETDASGWKALRAVIWLRVRREVELWRRWQPWAVGLGLALPSSFVLLGASVSVAWAFRGVLHGGGLHPDLVGGVLTFLEQALLMAGVAWCGGQTVALLSRRTLWTSALLCLIPCCFCLSRFRTEVLSPWCLLLFLVPAMCGIAVGLRRGHGGWKVQTGIAVFLTALALAQWRITLLTLCVLLWPAWYLATSARKTDLQ
ncbi:hypothetical protein ACFPT7_21745 [Acidicapsa dinghuensis]|uniref:Uncharacterized protein n=1 Tax=Acidicapsa dinghuensis TaxID=2218256 RepID=A0ABW1EMF0_9BACT|nr:hypothetical protein [Acidicapsa dinghuensis]